MWADASQVCWPCAIKRQYGIGNDLRHHGSLSISVPEIRGEHEP